MAFERSFMNWEEGVGICCWKAPNKGDLEGLFQKAGMPFERIIEVEEHVEESLMQ